MEVCFEVMLSPDGDADGDGLTDSQEIRGIDSDLDGSVDYVLPGATGAWPKGSRPGVFVI